MGRMLRPSAKTCKCSVVDDGGYVVLIINPRTETMVSFAMGKLWLTNAQSEQISSETIRFCPFCGRRLW